MFSPLEQFRYPIVYTFSNFAFNINLSILTLFIVQGATMLLLFVVLERINLIPNSLYLLIEEIRMVMKGFGDTYFPTNKNHSLHKGTGFQACIFSLFTFLLMVNLSGIIPYTTTITTHFAVTVAAAMFFYVGLMLYLIFEHGRHVFQIFLPHGIPAALSPFLILIEIVLFLFRPLSLSIRLFANMMAGHALLKIISVACCLLIIQSCSFFFPIKIVYFLMCIIALNFIILLEVLVCCIQAYVFTLLICVYLKDMFIAH
jgi:ATP synthase subunit 6